MAILFSVVTAIWTVALAVTIAVAWTGSPIYELIPEGIRARSALASLFIPWEALYTGGPARPPLSGLNMAPMRLAVAAPELVRIKGLFRAQSRKYPALNGAFNAHPCLLSDAIRWYAEHPEHRAGIGTQKEHDRLISTVTADYPRIDETRKARPGLVTAAVWVAGIGAGIGLLLAAANLYIAVAFEDRIAAAMRAAEEEPFLPDPILPAIWLGLVLVGAVLTGFAARGVWRGNPMARAGLMVLSGLVVLSGCVGSCFGSSTFSLMDAPQR
jgi:hypothetical protein